MATTMYFEAELSALDSSANADPTKPTNQIEIYISSYSREHQLYLKHIDGDGKEVHSVISKDQAKQLLEGLESAMGYLGYDK